MDLRDYGYVELPSSKEEELEWRRKEEERLLAEEKKIGRPLTSPLRELSNQKKSIQIIQSQISYMLFTSYFTSIHTHH